MADFCFDCIQTVYPDVHPSRNDLRHSGAEPIFDVCEGCGAGYFDRDGKRVQTEDDRKPWEDPAITEEKKLDPSQGLDEDGAVLRS